MMDYCKVLVKKYPGTSWKMENASDYNTLEWYDETSKPSKDDLDTKLTELQNAEPMRLLRVERNRLLAETDWISTKSIDTGVGISTDWKTYRQSLRDLPSGASPQLDASTPVGVKNITWPTKPS